MRRNERVMASRKVRGPSFSKDIAGSRGSESTNSCIPRYNNGDIGEMRKDGNRPSQAAVATEKSIQKRVNHGTALHLKGLPLRIQL